MFNIKVGDYIRDLDPRSNGKTVQITRIGSEYVSYQAGKRIANVRIDRIRPAGATQKSGWALV